MHNQAVSTKPGFSLGGIPRQETGCLPQTVPREKGILDACLSWRCGRRRRACTLTYHNGDANAIEPGATYTSFPHLEHTAQCLRISMYPVKRHLLNKVGPHSILSIMVSLTQCVYPDTGSPLVGKKQKTHSWNNFKKRKQYNIVVNSTVSNPSTTKKWLGDCGKIA